MTGDPLGERSVGERTVGERSASDGAPRLVSGLLVTSTLRALVFASPLLGLACSAAAAQRTFPMLDLVVVALAGYCALFPDSNAGLVVVGVVTVGWLSTVHEAQTPWSVGIAVSLAVFHTSMAAATVAAPGSSWTVAMCRRWAWRGSVVCGASAVAYGVVAVVGARRVPGGAWLLGAAMISLAVGLLWVRRGTPATDAGRLGR